MILSFKEFRKIKDSLPDGSMSVIAEKIGVTEDSVRNYFGGDHYKSGTSSDVHFEKGGSGGGTVKIQDTTILEAARNILASQN